MNRGGPGGPGGRARRAWFVTPTARPNVRLAGPFESYDECMTACVLRLGDLAVALLAAGKMPWQYTPRLFEFEIAAEVPPLYVPAPTTPPPTPRTRLPPVVRTYSRSRLLLLCRVLGLVPPSDTISRTQILAYIETELSTLEG